MVETFHFMKYNSETTLEHIIKISEMGATICFDLEDSICNWIDKKDNDIIKARQRTILSNFLMKIFSELKNIKTCVRINSFNSLNQKLDIEFLSEFRNLNAIIIPKVENPEHIDSVIKQLKIKNFHHPEIIPIIESKQGIENLYNIINSDYKITKVAFGHCDYNLDINAFPFFHQDSTEYWKWVDRILKILKLNNIKFLNSPYLRLVDLDFFKSILSNLNLLTEGNFGQITLTSKQTSLCRLFNNSSIPINEKTDDRLSLQIKKSDLTNFISNFENENKGKAFTINHSNRVLVSPQEYCSAKKHFEKWKERDINFTFVGSCFPVQHNILFEDEFHQILKRKIEKEYDVNFHVNIIRYERFIYCLDKIDKINRINPIDFLIFHIRPEPYLRLVKLYYKYVNHNNKKCRSLNIPLFKILNPEKYDMLLLARKYSPADIYHKTLVRRIFINLNYLLGWFTGNNHYALSRYFSLANEIISYCDKNKIKIIILGPGLRSNTFVEKILSKKLNSYISEKIKITNTEYVDGLVPHSHNGLRYFNENGIHATENYHELIANRLFLKFEKFIL
jgi:citrate lyase beta subunit